MKKVLSIALLTLTVSSAMLLSSVKASADVATTKVNTVIDTGGMIFSVPATLPFNPLTIGTTDTEDKAFNMDITNQTGIPGYQVTVLTTTADPTGLILKLGQGATTPTTVIGSTAVKIYANAASNSTKVSLPMKAKLSAPNTVSPGTSSKVLNWTIAPTP